MKEKISQVAKEIYQWEVPRIFLSKEALEFSVELGKCYSGSFVIRNSAHAYMKGIVYSSDENLSLVKPTFTGEEATISFTYSAENIAKDVKNRVGVLTIVTNFGEVTLPYEAIIETPYFESTLGRVKDLFHLTNLAKTDWSQAVHIFKSPDFKRIILADQEKYQNLYDGLIKSPSTSQALEEFLIAIHKKMAINIAVDKVNARYEDVNKSFKDKIVLSKDHWGYKEYRVWTDANFIIPEHKYIWTDNFVMDTYTLEYMIDASLLCKGPNIGHIYISSVYQTIEITIEVYRASESQETDLERRNRHKKAKYNALLVKKYMDFRLNVLSKEEYVDSLEAVLTNLTAIDPSTAVQLWTAHFYMVAGKKEKLRKLMDAFVGHERELLDESVNVYLAYLYLNALYTKKPEDITKAIETIEEYYHKETKDWKLLWYLLYLDKKYDEDHMFKLHVLREQFEAGVNSPVLYFEACLCFNQEPELLMKADELELSIIHWGIRHNCFKSDLAEQYVFMCSRTKGFNKKLYYDLCVLYKQYPTNECLQTICRMLISGRMTDNQYFKWYKLGVEKQLKITELYEYYIYAMDETSGMTIDYSVLLYFIYNNNLTEAKKAFLYAYIIKHKDEIVSIFNTYRKQMESFSKRMLERKYVNNNLAILYEEMLTENIMDENVCRNLPFVLFQYEITCSNQKMCGVIVSHNELIQEEKVPFENGRALITLVTDNVNLYLYDVKENRYVVSTSYTLNPLFHNPKLIEICYQKNKQDIKLLLHMNQTLSSVEKKEKEGFFIQNRLLESEEISLAYKSYAYVEMIEYYYSMNNMEKLEEYLRTLDLTIINTKERCKVIEYMIMRDLIDEAYEAIHIYGYEQIAIKRLKKLACILLERNTIAYPDKMLALCYFIYNKKQATEPILQYLVNHYQQSTQNLYEMWKSAMDMKLETAEIEEKLLGQMLFSESLLLRSYEVFISYYRHPINRLLVQAYLNYCAYKYLIEDRVTEYQLFDIMRKEMRSFQSRSCQLALLKYYSTQGQLDEETLKFADVKLHQFIKDGIVLSFFKDYRDRLEIPHSIYDKYYVQYITNPKNKVTIYYCVLDETNNESNYIKQTMTNMYEGIFVMDFILFVNETLQYYIVEENEDGQSITESTRVSLDPGIDKVDNRYGQINLMYQAKEIKDEKTLIELMRQYIVDEQVATTLFTPL